MEKNCIKSIRANEILDSKGTPTIEVNLESDLGIFKSSVPSGTSTGKHEAVELRDGGKRYWGKGVLKAIENINKIIAPKIKGKNALLQEEIDTLMIDMDGTENKSNLGANAILAVSLAVCRAGAKAKSIPLYQYISQIKGKQCAPALPNPCFLMIEGALHAGNNLDVQEFMIVPKKNSFAEKLRIGTEIYHALESILKEKYGKAATNVGYEGGFAPPLKYTKEALDLIIQAVEKAGYENNIKIVLDVAASTFYQKGSYRFEGKNFSRKKLLSFYSNLCENYPIAGIEDPFSEEDWQSFQKITETLGKKIIIIGDDLLVTNIEKIKKAASTKACNGLILKPNQIGTVTEAIKAATRAMENGWQVFAKHRSGETNDDFISDLGTGLGAYGIMAGAPNRGERVAKYNRLLRIEREIK